LRYFTDVDHHDHEALGALNHAAGRGVGIACYTPIPASSGKVTRHRLNPGGDRQANHALWRIVFTRLGSDPATRAYAERRTAEGKSKAGIIRCPKRYVAREVYRHLRPAAG
jgi:transposase